MKILTAALALAVVSSTSQSQRKVPPSFFAPQAFSVVIEHSGNQWRAFCEFGCAWKSATLSFECKEACDATVDYQGLVTTATRPSAGQEFSFSVSIDKDGRLVAAPNAGTHWRQLGWGCGNSKVCTARINEFGVQGGISAKIEDVTRVAM